MNNPIVYKHTRELKRASALHNAPIWAKLAEYALKPSSARRNINLKRIGQLTKDNDVVVFPGKVLGTGNVPHSITLFSFSISAKALSKIKGAGGKVVTHTSLIDSNPTGRGVVLLG